MRTDKNPMLPAGGSRQIIGFDGDVCFFKVQFDPVISDELSKVPVLGGINL